MNNLKSGLIILLTMLFGSTNIFAQITIDQNDLPSPGDTIRVSNAVLDPSLDYATSGPNSIWDFSNIQWSTQEVDSFVNVNSTGIVYSVVFVDISFNPNRANVAELGLIAPPVPLVTITDAIGFYYKTSSIYEQAGYGADLNGVPTAVPFDNRDVFYNLPLNYGDIDSSDSNYSASIPGIGFYAHEQKRVNEVDGWGIVTTPYGTFDAIRVKSTITGRDSVFVSSTGLGFAFDTPIATEYKWLSSSMKIPVLQFNTTIPVANEIINRIAFIDSVHDPLTSSIPEFSKSVVVDIFPNPANYHAHMNVVSDVNIKAEISILTYTGKVVSTAMPIDIRKGTNYISLDGMISELSPGFYITILRSSKGVVTRKLIISN